MGSSSLGRGKSGTGEDTELCECSSGVFFPNFPEVLNLSAFGNVTSGTVHPRANGWWYLKRFEEGLLHGKSAVLGKELEQRREDVGQVSTKVIPLCGKTRQLPAKGPKRKQNLPKYGNNEEFR